MERVKIIGVPEHFNMPWHFAIEEGAFGARDIDLVWEDIPQGTGRMCQMLQDQEADIAIVLTEGICKAIYDGVPAQIIQMYVGSPLLWGIHVGYDSPYHTMEELKGRKAAISRYGSGSHLMAYVHAKQMGWKTDALEFELIGTLQGAVGALSNGKADYFMWEHFTTKPLVDQKIFRRIDDCTTPWPCFVIAASQDFINKKAKLIPHILEVINTYTAEFRYIPSIDRTFSNRYDQSIEDIQEWLGITDWSHSQLETQMLDTIIDTLSDLKLINDKNLTCSPLWYPAD
ncbi:MAG: substrate-binding domain-containing protein [Flavobacteriaceae bacterium]|nr:substrate-binding domain-containing protein [Flavobacteriaceae bacterium]